MISWIILSILYILPLIFVARLNISLTSKIFIFAIIDFIFYRITNRRNGYNSSELIEKLARILIYYYVAFVYYIFVFLFCTNYNIANERDFFYNFLTYKFPYKFKIV